jgi:hypothetical protein
VIVSLGLLYGVTASPLFGVETIRLEGGTFTSQEAVEVQLAVPRDANLFTLRTEPLETALANLPTVAVAEVTVALPSTLVVRVTEREPILLWRVDERRLLVDIDGRVVGELAAGPAGAAGGLPVVVDRRVAARRLEIGSTLDAADLDAARRLASVTPDEVGSAAGELRVAITDEHGFVVTAPGVGWTAIFGFYTPTLRTTDLIPEQVRLLRSLLAGRETTIDRVVLASATEGTFTLKPGARPTPTAEP